MCNQKNFVLLKSIGKFFYRLRVKVGKRLKYLMVICVSDASAISRMCKLTFSHLKVKHYLKMLLFFSRYEYHWCDGDRYKKPTSVPAQEVWSNAQHMSSNININYECYNVYDSNW